MNASLLALAAVSLSTTATADPVDNLAAKVDAYLDVAYPDAGPGVAAIIVDDGQIIYHGAQGMADIKAGEALTRDSVFRLGSITKQFAAATVMKLVEQGKVALDDPLTKYVPGYPNGDAITVRMLLNHTSGVKSYTGINGWMTESNTNKPFPTADLIAEFKDVPADFAPGQGYSYNNSGYVLVGAVIEAATGRPWHQAVHELLLAPAGIDGIDYMGAEARTAAMAQGYSDFQGNIIPSQLIVGDVPHAAGALIGNVGALATWYDALMDGRIVSPASLELMTEPTRTLDGMDAPYGFGLQLGEQKGRRIIGHGGGIFGFSTESIYFPDEDLFVAVFANSDSPSVAPSQAGQRLAALALGDDVPLFKTVEMDLAALEGALGRYMFGEDEYRDLYVEDGKLMARVKDGRPLQVYAAGDGIYHYGPTTMSWFKIDRSGEKPRSLFHADGAIEPVIGIHAGDIPEAISISLTDAQIAGLVGRYSFPFGTMVVSRSGEGITGQLGDQQAFMFAARSETEFVVEQVGARLVFTVEDGRASALTLFQGGREFTAPRVKD